MGFLTLIEWKVLGYMQLWKGPNNVVPYGLLQPTADVVKLFIKGSPWPATSFISIFIITPTLALILPLTIRIPWPVPHESSVTQLCPTLCDLMTVAHQAPLSMEFSRQEYWTGKPVPYSLINKNLEKYYWYSDQLHQA